MSVLGRYHFEAKLIWRLDKRPVGLSEIRISTLGHNVTAAMTNARELLPVPSAEQDWKLFLEKIEEVQS